MAKHPFVENVEYIERSLEQHGDSALGVGWPRGAEARYQVMLDVIRPQSTHASLLDFGCGAAHLLEFIRSRALQGIDYHGLDASPRAIELCRRKFPDIEFLALDVLAEDALAWPDFDYVVMNGVLTYKGGTSQAAMFEYARTLVKAVFRHVRVGLAFNVLSKHVDQERDELFHLEMDPLIGFLSREVSRHLVIRADYGLYEYTVHVYRDPVPGSVLDTRALVGSASAEP